MAETIYVMSA